MELIIGTILGIVFVILGICIYKVHKEKHRLSGAVNRILILGELIVFVNMVSLCLSSETCSRIFYSVYFVAVDWMLWSLMRFSLEYIGNKVEYHVCSPIICILLILDSISVSANMYFGHLFVLNPITLLDGDVYYSLTAKPLFYIQHGIVLMLVVFSLITTLIYRTFRSQTFYRRKYITSALLIVIMVVLNVFSLTGIIGLSVFGYVVEGLFIYYSVFVYTPQKLLPKTLFLIAQDMPIAIFMIDKDGNLLYSNHFAEQLLNTDNPVLDRKGTTLEQWCCGQNIEENEEYTKEKAFYRDGKELILKIQFQRMIDAKGMLEGGYFIIQDRTEEVHNVRREKYLTKHDNLTGVYNKDYFYEKVKRYIKQHPEMELLMICTDIKDFKMINDFLGTKTGDAVLVNFAKILKKQFSGAIYYGRLGNDVFAILMSKENYQEVFLAQDNQEAFFEGMEKDVSFPIINYVGVYEIEEPELPVSVMCDRARMAIATIKGDYHKRVAYYDTEIRDNIMYEQELITDLSEALNSDQLKMYLQPQMSAEGKLLGAEALVRWIHPTKGAIMPGKFIPIFERNGLISDVDRHVWELACKQLKKWKDEGRGDIYISVNISPRDFYFLNIYQIFMELVQKYDVDPQNLKLEITETAIVLDLKRQMELLTRLRKKGFVVEMDDFGSGYSSLNMLKDIHVDILKIDMAFLQKAEDEERSKKILQMMITLSNHLGMPVITEGVETAEQVEFLKEIGCDMFQGYYFAKPMTVEEFEKMYFEEPMS